MERISPSSSPIQNSSGDGSGGDDGRGGLVTLPVGVIARVGVGSVEDLIAGNHIRRPSSRLVHKGVVAPGRENLRPAAQSLVRGIRSARSAKVGREAVERRNEGRDARCRPAQVPSSSGEGVGRSSRLRGIVSRVLRSGRWPSVRGCA